MTVSPRIYVGIGIAGAMSLAAFALCVTANVIVQKLVWWPRGLPAALVVEVTT